MKMQTHITGKRTAILAMFLFPLVAAGCSTNPATGKKHFIFISQEQEIAIGAEAAPEFEKEFGGKVPNQELQAYVRMVGGKASAVSERKMPYEFTLVQSKVPNAFALPGGKIFITAGLMSKMTNERQLAAVLGHETGHVAAQHNVLGMQKQMGIAVLADIAGKIAGEEKAESAQAAAKVVAGMASLKYSRDDEYEADELGIRYMTGAGYNPWGMVELLTVLQNLSESESGSLTEMFRTHPLTSKRIAEARDIIEDKHKGFSPSTADPNAARFLQMRSLLLNTVSGLTEK
ncbi:MAG: M48 family metalloprotease [Planctomycetota bacterium]|nr:M48 family metalloprotease [Planctomycetota bacterium]